MRVEGRASKWPILPTETRTLAVYALKCIEFGKILHIQPARFAPSVRKPYTFRQLPGADLYN
jgi:hypothetical protein